MNLMGIDVGTSSCRVCVVDETGTFLTVQRKGYEVKAPGPGLYELDPEDVWSAVATSIKKANGSVPAGTVGALGISAQGEAIMPFDFNGQVLRRSPISADSRGADYIRSLAEEMGLRKLHTLTGQLPDPIHSIGKLKWWSEHEPQVIQETKLFGGYPELLHLRMGLPPMVDHGLASRTMLFDIGRKTWADVLTKFAGIDQDRLPAIGPSGYVVGKIPADNAESLGFSNQPLVVLGGHDQVMAAVGGGLRPGRPVYSIGTTECIVFQSEEPLADDALLLPSYPYADGKNFVTLNGSQAGGRVFDWLSSVVRTEVTSQSKKKRFLEEIDDLEPDYTNPLLFVPGDILGAYSRDQVALGGGAFIGLTSDATRSDMIFSVLEGITYSQSEGFPYLRSKFGPFEYLSAVGGGAKSDLWLQVKADALGSPVARMKNLEAGCLGAAMLAGVGLGIYSDIEEAQQSFCTADAVFEPNGARFEYHQRKSSVLQRYKSILNEGNFGTKQLNLL
jgi:xylulokinase